MLQRELFGQAGNAERPALILKAVHFVRRHGQNCARLASQAAHAAPSRSWCPGDLKTLFAAKFRRKVEWQPA
jgi:hypothetical protein